nr:hypothetical protein [Tanacetum cinerariifolium]
MVDQLIQKKQEEKQIQEDQAANTRYWKIPAYYDDDDDYNFAVTPNETVNSLIIGDKHLDTVPATESDEFIKSSVENLVPNPSESEGENGCDLLACFTTFSNILFDAEYEFDSVNDQSLHNEDFSEEIFLNPLFEEEISSIKIDQHHFNAESDLVESMLNHDTSIISSFSKINSLLDEFAGELPLLKSIPSGVDKTDYHPENEIRLSHRLLYDNSSPRPPEEFVSENSNADDESFSPSPIPIEDSDYPVEKIDLTFTPDDPMPPNIEEDDDDSRDTLICEELFDNYSLPLPENESFHFDIPSFSRPPAKPPDGTKLSKLDRFLISEDAIDLLPDICITALDRIWSDHNPTLLHVDKIDFGPSPFKLYNSWLLRDGFDDLIKTEWDSLDSNNSGFPIKCHEKFRILKDKIRQLNNNNKTMKRNKKAAALEELSSIKKKIDEGSASPSDTENCLNLLHELEIIDKFASMDLIQKARVKWDIEGDENTKFFHGLINRKRRNQMINDMDLFSLMSAPNPAKVKTKTRPRATHEVPLLTANANRVIDMEDMIGASGSSGTPSTGIHRTRGVAPEPDLEKEMVDMGTLMRKRRRKRRSYEAEANALPKVLRKDCIASYPPQSTLGGKSLASIGIGTGTTVSAPATQEIPIHMEGVSDPDLLSYVKPRSAPEQDVSQSSRKAVVTKDLDSKKSTSFTSMVGSPGSIYQPRWGVINNCCLDTPTACQDMVDHIVPPWYFSELRHLPNDEFLNQYNTTLSRQVAMGSQLRLRFEQETKLLKKAVAQGAAEAKNVELAMELESLRVQFSDLQDDRVSSRCAKIDARLDALSIDFDDGQYPHMLTEIVGHRWIIGPVLRLAVMKCVESTELRQFFVDFVSAKIVKGMSEGVKQGVEHGKAKLEKLKDAPIDVIMASLFLESDSGEDGPQWIRELRPSSSQLKITVYLEVRNPKDTWSFKDEILLEDAITTNVSRTEKKKKCGVVCRTYGVSSIHHFWSDGVLV